MLQTANGQDGSTAANGESSSSTKTIEVKDFSQLEVNLNYDVVLVQGDENKVVLKMSEAKQKRINCHNEGSKLVVEESGESWWETTTSSGASKVTIYFKDINRLISSCNGSIKGDVSTTNKLIVELNNNGRTTLGLHTATLLVESNCNGSVHFSGNAETFVITNNNNGALDAEELKAEVLTLTNNANGRTRVYASNTLTIDHSGNGSLSYSGKPTQKNITNNGNGAISER
jgi:hypothetical protein